MTISSPAHSIGMALSLVTATAGRGSASHRCARITAFRCSNLLMTGSSRGSISARPRGFSRSHPKPADWRRRPARSPPSIPCPKALGSLPVPISRHQPHKQSQNARAKIQNTPRDRIAISKISFLQPHRQMGVVMQDCTTRFENTHRTAFREVLYRHHPWFGRRVCVHGAVDKAGYVVFRCALDGSQADRWLVVPAWMVDRTACPDPGLLTAQPYVSIEALAALSA